MNTGCKFAQTNIGVIIGGVVKVDNKYKVDERGPAETWLSLKTFLKPIATV
jgi:hypothetical protein